MHQVAQSRTEQSPKTRLLTQEIVSEISGCCLKLLRFVVVWNSCYQVIRVWYLNWAVLPNAREPWWGPGTPQPSERQPPPEFAYCSCVQPLIRFSELLCDSPESLSAETINTGPGKTWDQWRLLCRRRGALYYSPHPFPVHLSFQNETGRREKTQITEMCDAGSRC